MARLSSEILPSQAEHLYEETPDSDIEEEEIRAQKSLAILINKDERIKELQCRLSVLEKLAGKLDRLDEALVPDVKSSNKLLEKGDFEYSSETSNNIEPLYSETPCTDDSITTNFQNSSSQNISELSKCTTDVNHTVNDLPNYNNKLFKAIPGENELYSLDHKKFCKILDSIHFMLRAIKTGSEFPSQISLTQLYLNKEENLSQSLLSTAIKSNKYNESLKKSMWTIPRLNDDHVCQLPKHLSCDTSTVIKIDCPVENNEETILTKLQKVEKDMEEVNSLVKDSQEKVSCEKKAQKTMQSAWCARFKIQMNKMERLEKRYRKVCRYLMDTKRNNLKQKPFKTRSEECRKLPVKESGTRKNDKGDDSIRTIGLLRGRLDAAHIVMNKQKAQLLDLQQKIKNQSSQIQTLKQRLMKSEMRNASKESLAQTQAKEYDYLEIKNKDSTEKYSSSKQEAEVLKQTLNSAQVQIVALKNQCNKALEENDAYEVKLIESKSKAERELLMVSRELLQERNKVKEWELKFNQLYKNFLKTTETATERITKGNKKLKEFFRAIVLHYHRVTGCILSWINVMFPGDKLYTKPAPEEIFLELAYKAGESSAVLEAEKIASSILNIPSNEVHKITSSRTKHPQLQEWIKRFKQLITKDNFSEELAQFLHSLVLQDNKQKEIPEEKIMPV